MQTHPVLYQLNTRVYLTEISKQLGRRATLEDIPQHFIGFLADRGVTILWLLSVWATGPRSQQESRGNPQWLHEFSKVLDNLQTDDIGGSGFAIEDYRVSDLLGGPKALAGFRTRLSKLGIKLMLDFVPNHMGLDHAWLCSDPEYLIQGTQELLEQQPRNYFDDPSTGKVFAHGRDPYFEGWSDTVQLDYSNPLLQDRMQEFLVEISDQCDAVRCDMAILLVPRVFERTWGRSMQSFWDKAIHRVKSKHPEFVFMAEVYWDMEWELQQDGFDFCYDKRLYDRLRESDYLGVRNHLKAEVAYQSKLARFLENHDEPRAASTFGVGRHATAAVSSYLTPGLRFFQHGQWSGAKVKVSPHLVRGPQEESNGTIEQLYRKLTTLLKDPLFHQGEWELLDIQRAWDENWSSDCFLAWLWKERALSGPSDRVVMCIVNLAEHEAQCKIEIPNWLRPMSKSPWRNLWTDEIFEMPTDQWSSGWWTLFAQGSQVFVLEAGI